MIQQNKVTGVVLAGGLARRMDNKDKGLVIYQGQPMVKYAVDTMSRVAGTVLINANRNQEEYAEFGCHVINDRTDTFDGPLAGVFSAMTHTSGDILAVMPCDSPLIKPEHLQRLLEPMNDPDIDIAVAFDGIRLHPVFLALKTSLQASLEDYLQQGQRKIDIWLKQHRLFQVDFSQDASVFININTLAELQALEQNKDGE